MRIIAGKFKRRVLSSPPGNDITRPTSDRVKESMFNIISPDLDGALVLDLFSGSGALGLEALSRGARSVVAVERNPEAIRHLQANVAMLKLPHDEYTLLPVDVSAALAPNGPLGKKLASSINLVLADPPYAASWYDEAIADLEASGLCAPGCLALFEMASTRRMVAAAAHLPWSRIDERDYGSVRIEIWRRNEPEEPLDDTLPDSQQT